MKYDVIKKIYYNLTLNNLKKIYDQSQIFLIRLPNLNKSELELLKTHSNSNISKICHIISNIIDENTDNKILVFLGPVFLFPYIYAIINDTFFYRDLISVRLNKIKNSRTFFPNEHIGIMIISTRKFGIYNRVRKSYSYCKCCKKTVKDYGGKKHLLDKRGTQISDVWTDITMNYSGIFPNKIMNRLYDLLHRDCKKFTAFYLNQNYLNDVKINVDQNIVKKILPTTSSSKLKISVNNKDKIFNTDVLIGFKKIKNKSVNLALVDPPYNLSIKYGKYLDNLNDDDYQNWCINWINEIERVLSSNGILALVNIPYWSLKLFPYLNKKFKFQGWITWDSFSYPSTPIMPAHYPILCFSKKSYSHNLIKNKFNRNSTNYDLLHPMNYGYCIRTTCSSARAPKMLNDRKILSDLWTDIHRIRHNSYRYNHPTLMPEKLAKRLILMLTKKNDVVLDCFNGVGTTSLTAKSQNRYFLGIEKNKSYYNTSIRRHKLLKNNKNPFAKQIAKSTSSIKGYRKIKSQIHTKKKILQMDVKRITLEIGHIPSKKELIKLGTYPFKHYNDNFSDWAEITAAARRSGLNS